uniref:Guanine nucleotide-binding protein subunit beta-like protein A n=1 Tax=Ananas comosus var. bracteatus TaxID=296719 RepID=A0A6V7NY77_ANACO|nr:unnamed protein product [Ananas comosus var. bracteatus]
MATRWYSAGRCAGNGRGDGDRDPDRQLGPDRVVVARQVGAGVEADEDAASAGGDAAYGVPQRRLTGHSHFVQDVVLSSTGSSRSRVLGRGAAALDINLGTTTRRFVGHTKDVLSVAFSVDNRQIVTYQPLIVSGFLDRTVKVWNLTNCKLRCTLTGHAGYVNTVAVSPDGSLCASGGKDGVTLLWDLAEGKRLYSLDAGAIIHALCFSPTATGSAPPPRTASRSGTSRASPSSRTSSPRPHQQEPARTLSMLYCTSLSWSIDGSTLFTGYTDGTIRVWKVNPY